MAEIGYFLSSEEHTGPELVHGAVLAERSGFRRAWISDHFHPWLDDQGQSPFVWSVLGAIAQATSELRVTTAATCPTVRIHPVVIAQAAATTAQLFGDRFSLGVGSGENLNEHVTGAPWPRVAVRQRMLEEAVGIIRALWRGELTSIETEHYTVDNARLYTLPGSPPDIVMSGFGDQAVQLAARIADGFMTTMPDADAVRRYRDAGGSGRVQGGVKVCWADSEEQAVKTAHQTWRMELVPGQLAQDAPLPMHFEQVSQLVSEEMVAEKVVCGPDPKRHAEALQAYLDAGCDEVYVGQMGPDQEGMIRFYEREVLPLFRG